MLNNLRLPRTIPPVCAAAWLLLPNLVLANSPALIDRTFTAKGDVVGTHQTDVLTVHVIAASINAPFTWTASITDPDGRTIFKVEHADASIDKFFHDAQFERDCSGYASCKERYYFHDLPAAFFAGITPSPMAWEMDSFFMADLTETVTDFMQRQGATPRMIAEAIEEIKDELQRPGFHALYLLDSPVEDTSPMIWVPSAKEFVPF